MLRYYFISNLRYFKKNIYSTVINILGLSIGISASIIIYLIVQYHYSFDKFEPDNSLIYRVVSQIKMPGATFSNWGVPFPLPLTIRNRIPGIKEAAPIIDYGYDNKVSISTGNGSPPRIFQKQEDIVFADSSYFKIIPYEWIAGDRIHALNAPFSIVLTKNSAELYFAGLPIEEVVGMTVLLNDSLRVTITGIVKDQTHLSDFKKKSFISLSTIPVSSLSRYYGYDKWHNISSASQCLVLLSPNIRPAQIESQLNSLEMARLTPTASGDTTENKLQRLSDIHFNELLGGKADKSSLNGLMLIALFLLLIGSINFINLSTAEASHRINEIAVRKILGSSKAGIILRFLCGTLVLVFFAAIFSLVLSPFVLSIFSNFIPSDLKLSTVSLPGILAFLLGILITITLMSGIYPGIVLARQSPVRMMRGYGNAAAVGKEWPRKVLTILQFVVAQVLVIATLVVASQINFSLHRDMGFRKTAIVNIRLPKDKKGAGEKRMVFRNLLRSSHHIKNLTLGSVAPIAEGSMAKSFDYTDGKTEIETLAEVRSGDTNYVHVFDLKLIAGTNIPSADSPTALIVNEAYAKLLGFANARNAINQRLVTDRKQPVPIIGIVKDFATSRESNGIKPLVFYADSKSNDYIHVLLDPDNASGSVWRDAMASIKQAYNTIYPEEVFDYQFFDSEVNSLFQEDEDLFKILVWSASVSIFIGCLGMLGLIIFIARKKKKEIAVRRVLGASITQIVSLLSADFIRLIALGIIISIPIAWLVMHKWLENFADQISLSWWIFFLGGMVMAVISITILCMSGIRSAMANPAKSLRTQ